MINKPKTKRERKILKARLKWQKSRTKKGKGYVNLLKNKGYSKTHVYLVKYTTKGGTVFYKVGVSVDPYFRVRRDKCWAIMVGVLNLESTIAWEIETHVIFQMMINKFQQCPYQKFDGKTECFGEKGYNYILPYLKGKGMKIINRKVNWVPIHALNPKR